VVYYRLAVMSKDADWIVRETDAACANVRQSADDRSAVVQPARG